MLNKNEYILLDAARLEANLHTAQDLNKAHLSLYEGSSDEDLAEVGPYLFAFSKNSEFSDWYMENGLGQSWGVLITAVADFNRCLTHFKSFLTVKTEDSQELYFRFYDPRVLKIFLPTCDKSQILEFFGPIQSFIVEGDTKEEAIRFWQHNGELFKEILSVEAVRGLIPGIAKNL